MLGCGSRNMIWSWNKDIQASSSGEKIFPDEGVHLDDFNVYYNHPIIHALN